MGSVQENFEKILCIMRKWQNWELWAAQKFKNNFQINRPEADNL